MWIDTFEKLIAHCRSIHDMDDFLSGYYWEQPNDDSPFVGAEISYESNNRIYYFNVYTEKYVYIAKEIHSENGPFIVWSSAPRTPYALGG